jgi:hypothetical protein
MSRGEDDAKDECELIETEINFKLILPIIEQTCVNLGEFIAKVAQTCLPM